MYLSDFFSLVSEPGEHIPETNINARKSKEQIKKQLNESVINGEQHENKGAAS